MTTRICEYGVCEQGEEIVMARFANVPNARCSVTIEGLDIQVGPFVADVTPFTEDTKQFITAHWSPPVRSIRMRVTWNASACSQSGADAQQTPDSMAH